MRVYGLVGLLLLAACRGHVAEAPQVAKASAASSVGEVELDRQAMQLDLDDWLATLTTVHPDPYARIEQGARGEDPVLARALEWARTDR